MQGLQICEDWVDLIEFIIQKFIQTMGSSPHTCAANMVSLDRENCNFHAKFYVCFHFTYLTHLSLLQVKCLDYTEVVDESGLTGIQTNKLFWHFTQV